MVAGAAGAPAVLELGRFSSAQPGNALPHGWEPLKFKDIDRPTRYTLVSDEGRTVVRASADASASGLIRPIEADPRATPIITWRWKIANLITRSDPRTKQTDDYPARVYITFKADPDQLSLLERAQFALARTFYGVEPPHSGLTYIWDRSLPVGTIVPNAYTDRVRMFVVESGAAHVDRWRSYERNLLEDYRKAFGADPPAISGVAIMTDTDNTGERAVAYYGDISLRASAPP